MSSGSGTPPFASDPIWPPSHTVPPAMVAWENPWAGPSSAGLTFRGGFDRCTTLVCRAQSCAARGHLMQISQSAHVDTFTRENLPPKAGWPEFLFTLPQLKYPASINCAVELLDHHVSTGAGTRRCIVTDAGTWTYSDLLARSNEVARVLVEE